MPATNNSNTILRKSPRGRIAKKREDDYDYRDYDKLTAPKRAKNLDFRYSRETGLQKIGLVSYDANEVSSALPGIYDASFIPLTPKRIKKTNKTAHTTTPSRSRLHKKNIKVQYTTRIERSGITVQIKYSKRYSLYSSDPKPVSVEPSLLNDVNIAQPILAMHINIAETDKNCKRLNLIITAAQIAELKKTLPISLNLSRNQNKVMDDRPASVVAEGYNFIGYHYAASGRKKHLFEWGHLGEFALLKNLGIEAQVKGNLVAMTKEANTHMMIVESILRWLIMRFDATIQSSIEINVEAELIEFNADLAAELEYTMVNHYTNGKSIAISQFIDTLSADKPSQTVKKLQQKFYQQCIKDYEIQAIPANLLDNEVSLIGRDIHIFDDTNSAVDISDKDDLDDDEPINVARQLKF
jgi:hypothetical protein